MFMLPRIEKDQGAVIHVKVPELGEGTWKCGPIWYKSGFRANSASIVEHALRIDGTLRQKTLGLRDPLDEKILLQIAVKHFPLVSMSIDGDNKADSYKAQVAQ